MREQYQGRWDPNIFAEYFWKTLSGAKDITYK
jgi:hypothetical protein